MTKKCDSCRHRTENEMGLLGTAVRCSNRSILQLAFKTERPVADMPLTYAREICNKEGDGIFVYFEPKEPASGAVAASPVQQFVQINREVRESLKTPSAGAAVQPDDWRKEMHKHMTAGGVR